jgi:hypothetical protein
MKKPLQVVSLEVANHEARHKNASRTPNERVEALRNAFITPDQCRHSRTCRYIKLP